METKELFLFSGGYASFSFVYESENPLINGKKRLTLSVEADDFPVMARKESLVPDALSSLVFGNPDYLFTVPQLVPDRLDDYQGFNPLYKHGIQQGGILRLQVAENTREREGQESCPRDNQRSQ